MKPTLFFLTLITLSQAAPVLKIEAGAHNRIQTIVTVPIPANVPRNPILVSKTNGIGLPLQLSDDGSATFILPELAAGKSEEFIVVGITEKRRDRAVAKKEGGDIVFSSAGKPVTTFRGKEKKSPRPDIDPIFLRGGYLHPLLTPTGNVVTGDYPASHPHHHGVWTAWTRAVFQGRKTDFWNMGQGLGKVDCKSIESSWSGAVHAGVKAVNEFVDLTSGAPIVALNERWIVKAYAVNDAKKPYHSIDFSSEQEVAGADDLNLPEYHYGGLGIRGRDQWDGKENAFFLTSEGVTDRDEANGKPAKWIFMGGAVEGGKAGLAILCSPENFRAPQPLRVHPTEPFVCFAPQVAGAMAIENGETYRSQYRFVIMDGAADKELLDRLWNDYSEPPIATWD